MSSRIVETTESACLSDSSTCVHHFHDSDPNYLEPSNIAHLAEDTATTIHNTSGASDALGKVQKAGHEKQFSGHTPVGLRMVIQNFTPSYA